MSIYLSLAVALVGVLLFALSKNPKLVRIGEICFFVGLLVFLFHWPANVLTLGR